MDMRIVILTVLVGAAPAIVGILIHQRGANAAEPSPYLARSAECLHDRRQMDTHVASRSERRAGTPRMVDSLFEGEAAAFVVVLRSPGPIAMAAGYRSVAPIIAPDPE